MGKLADFIVLDRDIFEIKRKSADKGSENYLGEKRFTEREAGGDNRIDWGGGRRMDLVIKPAELCEADGYSGQRTRPIRNISRGWEKNPPMTEDTLADRRTGG